MRSRRLHPHFHVTEAEGGQAELLKASSLAREIEASTGQLRSGRNVVAALQSAAAGASSLGPRAQAQLKNRYLPCFPLTPLAYESSRVYNAQFSSTGAHLVTASQDENIRIYDTRSWKIAREGGRRRGQIQQRVVERGRGVWRH